MRASRTRSVALACLLLCPVASQQAASPAAEATRVETWAQPIVSSDGQCVTYDGELNPLGAPMLLQEIQALVHSGAPPQCLSIRSPGGIVPSSIEIARIVHDYNLNVTVNEYCDSGCANNVFIAGREKTIPEGSVLNFHMSAARGYRFLLHMSSIGQIPVSFPRKILTNMTESVRLEQEFARDFGLPEEFYNLMPTTIDMGGFSLTNLPPPGTKQYLFSATGAFLQDCFGIRGITDFRTPEQKAANDARYALAIDHVIVADPTVIDWGRSCPETAARHRPATTNAPP